MRRRLHKLSLEVRAPSVSCGQQSKNSNGRGNLVGVCALTGMPKKPIDSARTRAEMMFKTREQQKADAPVAMQEYRAAQQAVFERMRQLRELRLAHEAKLAKNR